MRHPSGFFLYSLCSIYVVCNNYALYSDMWYTVIMRNRVSMWYTVITRDRVNMWYTVIM